MLKRFNFVRREDLDWKVGHMDLVRKQFGA